MLKKIILIFSILTVICVFVAIPLIPFAVRDTSDMLFTYMDQLQEMAEMKSFPLEGADTLKFNLRNYLNVRIRRSPDDQIHIYTDSAGFVPPTVSAVYMDNVMELMMEYDSNGIPFRYPRDTEEMRILLARAFIYENRNIEVYIPNGLVLEMEASNPNAMITIDDDVRFLNQKSFLSLLDKNFVSLEDRIQGLKRNMLSIVRSYVMEGSSDNLERNMMLNDLKIDMESCLLEYAEEQGAIGDPEEPDSSYETSAGEGSVVLTPVDTSVLPLARARIVISEASQLYLSRLVFQATLDWMERQYGDQDDSWTSPDGMTREDLEYQIQGYTSRIDGLNSDYPEFLTVLRETGLLF